MGSRRDVPVRVRQDLEKPPQVSMGSGGKGSGGGEPGKLFGGSGGRGKVECRAESFQIDWGGVGEGVTG